MAEINKINIDGIIYNLIDDNFYNMVANQYSNQNTYSEGDYCINNYQLYVCNTSIDVPEDFNSTKWDQLLISNKLKG